MIFGIGPRGGGTRPPVFDLDSLPQGLQDFYSQFLVYGRTAPATVKETYRRLIADGNIKTFFVNDRDFNAVAYRSENNHNIAVNVSVPCLLHFLYNVALRLPYTFTDVGDAAAELRYWDEGDRRSIPLALPDTASVIEALQMLPSASRPKDERRALVASALTEVAVAFCVFHEVGHVIGGHTGFAADRMGSGVVAEFGAGTLLPCPRRLLRQVWEREADVIAAVMTISFMVNDANTRKHFADCFGFPDDDDYPYHAFSVVLFALKILFLYLAQIPARLDVRGYHPHPLVRVTYLHNAIRTTAVDDLDMDVEALDGLLDAATDQADQVWADLGLRVPAINQSTNSAALASSIAKQIDRLEDAHKRLQPRYSRWSWLPESVWKEHQPTS